MTEKTGLRQFFELIRRLVLPAKTPQPSQSARVETQPTLNTETQTPKDAGQELYVVWDALGDGRVVGIFDNEELVRQILAINPFYYRFYRCKPGKPTKLALEWLDENQRRQLTKILRRDGTVSPKCHIPAPAGIIRQATLDDFAGMTKVWLQASLEAHDFVSSDFWHQNTDRMQKTFFPATESWVYCEDSQILGFMSLQKENLAALFVAPAAQGRGIGTRLLDQAKSMHGSLSLAVYERNDTGVIFFTRRGFAVMQSQKEPHTGENELIMLYQRR